MKQAVYVGHAQPSILSIVRMIVWLALILAIALMGGVL